jgi:hypothetical protein
MAKLSNITPGIAVVKEKIKSTDVLRVGINALGLYVVGTDDDKLKSDILQALEPAKGLFISNPRVLCEVSVIDNAFSSIYRMEKRFCITDAVYVQPQQIAAACGLPCTPALRVMVTPRMVLDIQNIMCGKSNENICEYLKFTANALSVSGTPVYGLTINNVFVKDRRSVNLTRIPDDQWSMSDTYKNIIWKSLISIAYNVISQKPTATVDDICQLYIKTYGSSWITKLVTFSNKGCNIELPGFMTALASSNITSEQLVNAYQLMVAILKGKFTGVERMDRDETVEYVKNLQKVVAEKLNSALGEAEEEPKEEPKEDKPKEEPKEDKPKEDKPKEDKPKEEPKEEDEKDEKESKEESEESEESDGEETGEEYTVDEE